MRLKFTRVVSRAGTPRKNTSDRRGTIRIQVMLIEPGHFNTSAGNIIRSVRVANATVSEVIEAIETSLLK